MDWVNARSLVLVASFMCSDEINAWKGPRGRIDCHFYAPRYQTAMAFRLICYRSLRYGFSDPSVT